MKTSRLIRITGDIEADVDSAINILCESGLPIGVDTQEKIVEEIAEYMGTQTELFGWHGEYKDLHKASDIAISIVERLTI